MKKNNSVKVKMRLTVECKCLVAPYNEKCTEYEDIEIIDTLDEISGSIVHSEIIDFIEK
jgi:hypothetical protein